MISELAKIGPSWNGEDIQTWPGVAGNSGESNYLAHNVNPFLPDPVNTSKFRGGKMKQTRKMKQTKTKKMKQNKTKKMKQNKTKKMKQTKTRKMKQTKTKKMKQL